MEQYSNVRVVPRDNPLILEIRVESDIEYNGFAAVSPESLMNIRAIINKYLLSRHYKIMIIDSEGIEFGGSTFLAKLLMCYEKATAVGCKVYSIRGSERLTAQHKLSGLDALIPVYPGSTAPTPENYEKFFFTDDIELDKEISEISKNIQSISNTEEQINKKNIEDTEEANANSILEKQFFEEQLLDEENLDESMKKLEMDFDNDIADTEDMVRINNTEEDIVDPDILTGNFHNDENQNLSHNDNTPNSGIPYSFGSGM